MTRSIKSATITFRVVLRFGPLTDFDKTIRGQHIEFQETQNNEELITTLMSEASLPLGVMVDVSHRDPHETLRRVKNMGFTTCQLGNPPSEYLHGPRAHDLTAHLRAAVADTGVNITAVFIMFSGHVWDLKDGPRTIGLVPTETRGERIVHACRMSRWALEAGIGTVTSHVGFIPDEDVAYASFLNTMTAFCGYVRDNGQLFAFETGQETALVLKRTIEDIGMDNVGVNLDPANLLLYDKDDPVAAVDLIGRYVFNTHCKDGVRPQPGEYLGQEMPLGEGAVDFGALIPKLHRMGYRGPLTIEREIEGDQQIADIERAARILSGIRKTLIG